MRDTPAEREGEKDFVYDNLCGARHQEMHGRIVVKE